MKCRYTKHVLNRMGERGIKKEMVQKVIDHYENKWVSKKNKRCEIFALDELRVVREKYNGVVLTVYIFEEGAEDW